MTQTKELQHTPALNRGVEYDENGQVCGEWAEEVCITCGALLGSMNSPAFCNRPQITYTKEEAHAEECAVGLL